MSVHFVSKVSKLMQVIKLVRYMRVKTFSKSLFKRRWYLKKATLPQCHFQKHSEKLSRGTGHNFNKCSCY